MKTLHPIAKVVDLFRSLPGVGPRMAERMAYYLIKSPADFTKNLSEAIITLNEVIHYCSVCTNFTDKEICEICSDSSRDKSTICVVEDVQGLLAIEKASHFSGLYHVLHGCLAPLEGIGPNDLTMSRLTQRVKNGDAEELILATNATVEGEATATYIHHILKSFKIRITRIAQGIPRGGDLEYTDGITLKQAFEGRKEMI
ncbi:MAG: recombination mediator RecR [bacterium]